MHVRNPQKLKSFKIIKLAGNKKMANKISPNITSSKETFFFKRRDGNGLPLGLGSGIGLSLALAAVFAHAGGS